MPHRMPKVRVPDAVQPNYLDASTRNGAITKLPCHLEYAINVINGPRIIHARLDTAVPFFAGQNRSGAMPLFGLISELASFGIDRDWRNVS